MSQQAPVARRILLIEDNELDARSMMRSLQRIADVDVVRTSDLAGGLGLLETESFDCVLLDLSLPDSEGLAGVDRVVATAVNCPTVVLTGLDDPSMAVEAVARGAQDYLVKGTATPELVERSVRYAIARFWTESRLVATERRLEAVETREQIARDLHDTVIQRLFATGMSLQAGLTTSDDDRQERVRAAVGDIDEAIRELRQAIFGLHSADESITESAVRNIVEEWREPLGVAPEVEITELPELSDGARHDLLSATRESLSNISRHASPTSVTVELSRDESLVCLRVAHVGPVTSERTEQTAEGSGRGLANLEARARARGGDCRVSIGAEHSEVLFSLDPAR